MAHIAGFLESLRAFLTADAPVSLGVVVTISPTSDSPLLSTLFPTLSYVKPNALYKTAISSSDNTVPGILPSTRRTPGWIIGMASPQGMLWSSEDESGLDLSSTLSHVASVDPSPDFRLYTDYRIDLANGAIASPDHHGQQLLRTLRTIPLSSSGRLPSALARMIADFCENSYWSLGVILPLLLLGIAVRVVMIESSTMVEHLQTRIKTLHSKKKRALGRIKGISRKLRTSELPSRHDASPEGASQEAPRTFGRWIAPYNRWRQRRWQQQIVRQREHLTMVEKKLSVWCRQWPHWKSSKKKAGERLRTLGLGAWDMVLEEVGGRRGVRALALGIVAVFVSFVGLHYSQLYMPIGRWPFAVPWHVLAPFGVSLVFVVSMVAARGRLRVFALGAATICLVGIDTIELSPFTDFGAQRSLNELYDSQTVTLMFTCVLLVVGVQEIVLHGRKPPGEGWISEGLSDADRRSVNRVRSRAKRKERLWAAALGLVYLLLVYHTLCPALAEIVDGNHQRPGLLSVTLVTAATLLVPFLSLVRLAIGYGSRTERERNDDAGTDAIVNSHSASSVVATGGSDGSA